MTGINAIIKEAMEVFLVCPPPISTPLGRRLSAFYTARMGQENPVYLIVPRYTLNLVTVISDFPDL